MPPSIFVRPMHPKSEIRADRASVTRVLEAGWVGQMKIHGHRAQIHIPSDPDESPIVYNRQGRPHKQLLSEAMIRELQRLFQPKAGWNVIDAEWLKPEEKLYVFDFIKQDGVLLNRLSYPERYALLPRAYISPNISTLPLLDTVEKCLAILEAPPANCEGLVFKSRQTKGFEDTSIVRCRIAK